MPAVGLIVKPSSLIVRPSDAFAIWFVPGFSSV